MAYGQLGRQRAHGLGCELRQTRCGQEDDHLGESSGEDEGEDSGSGSGLGFGLGLGFGFGFGLGLGLGLGLSLGSGPWVVRGPP